MSVTHNWFGACRVNTRATRSAAHGVPPSFMARYALQADAAHQHLDRVLPAGDPMTEDEFCVNPRRQERIDSGQLPRITSTDHAKLVAARKRIAALETELAIHRRTAESLKEAVPQKHGSRPSPR